MINKVQRHLFSKERPSYLVVICSLVLFCALSSCQPNLSTFVPATPAQTLAPTAAQSTSTPLPSPTPEPPYRAYIDPRLPTGVREAIQTNPGFTISLQQDQAQLSISPVGTDLIGYWTYLLVMPFYSLVDDLSFSDLYSLWSSGPTGSIPVDTLVVTEETLAHLSSVWGDPDPGAISTALASEIPTAIWTDPSAAALLPFELITHDLKIVSINSIHPLEIEALPADYPLAFPIYADYSKVLLSLTDEIANNFEPDKLTSIALTGVTALVRDTAVIMEEKGILYPAEDVQGILSAADITHINNEVPFKEDCPPPSSTMDSLAFCSDDRYIELIKYVGADVIELSGDHFGDKGTSAVLHTLDLYQENDLPFYGGGKDLRSGLEPLLFTHNDNRLAFIGCNAKAKGLYASATDTQPGAAECDFEWMVGEIRRLTENGYLVIATMQHEEVDSFYPIALQTYDFGQLAEAGASIVSGSQAHHPQGYILGDDHFIHYGLGNLFFDQWYLSQYNPELHANKDKGFIDLHYIYDNRYMNTRLIPIQFIDNARPRFMTADEKADFLYNLNYASRWSGNWIYMYPAGYYETTVTQ